MVEISSQQERILGLMSSLRFFRGFSAHEKQQIAKLKKTIMKVKAGDYIIRQGDIEFSIYILLKGKVAVTKPEMPRLTINILSPGDIFGELSSLAKRPRNANVVAKSEALLLKLDAELLETLDRDIQDKIKDQFIQTLAKRIDQMNTFVLKLKSDLEGVFHAEEQLKANVEDVNSSLGKIREEIKGISTVIGNLIY